MLPYVSGSSRVSGDRDRNNPFDSGANPGGNVGADMKVGLRLEPHPRGHHQSRLRTDRSRPG